MAESASKSTCLVSAVIIGVAIIIAALIVSDSHRYVIMPRDSHVVVIDSKTGETYWKNDSESNWYRHPLKARNE